MVNKRTSKVHPSCGVYLKSIHIYAKMVSLKLDIFVNQKTTHLSFE